jgi:uncharacterized protein YcsI (UPF0317 family)
MTITPSEFRQQVRSRRIYGPTAGYCGDFAQANLAILPRQYADDFLRFCTFNPKACPLLGMGEPGEWRVPALGADLDVRNDVPAFYVYRHGERAEEVRSLNELWRDDLVVFAIGCSFSFEEMLKREGIGLRHIEQKRNVPMYRTSEANVPAGVFGGRRDSRHPDHEPLSRRAWGTGASGRSVIDRYPRSVATGFRRCSRYPQRRVAGVLGLRCDTTGGH